MKIISKHLILSKKAYDFTNNDGERVQGLKLSYLNDKPSVRDNEEGFTPMIININDKSIVKSLKEIPGIYEMTFDQVTGKNNKPEIILSEVSFLSSTDLSVLF